MRNLGSINQMWPNRSSQESASNRLDLPKASHFLKCLRILRTNASSNRLMSRQKFRILMLHKILSPLEFRRLTRPQYDNHKRIKPSIYASKMIRLRSKVKLRMKKLHQKWEKPEEKQVPSSNLRCLIILEEYEPLCPKIPSKLAKKIGSIYPLNASN